MDRITKSLLEEFSKEHDLRALGEDKRFEHLATFLTVHRHHSETFDTSDVITGAGGDTGIDGLAIIVNGALATEPEEVAELSEANGYLDVVFIFVQAERSASFEMSKIGQFGFGVVDFFKDTPALPQNAAIADASAVMNAIYGMSSRFKRGNPVCRLYYVTTGKWVDDRNLEARRQAVINDLLSLRLFRDVDFTPVDADALQKLYAQTKNAISREFTFSEKTVIPEIPGVAEAYLGLVPAREFIRLLQDDSGDIIKSLFYDNVRDWQDFNPVNTEIRDTLNSETLRRQFVLMNNGITVIAKTLRATGNRFIIEDYQIVNGCQTSHVLFSQKHTLDESVVIPLRLIATQDEGVINSIIKATNRQTEVREEQLLALSDFPKKLEAFFQAFPDGRQLYYERRSRQFNNVPGIEKTRIVTPGNLIRAYAAMLLGEPHRTTKNYAALLDRVGKEIFGRDHKLEPYYLAALALYRLEYFFRNQSLDAKYKPARYHILYAARLLAAGSAPLPRFNSNEMERFCQPLIETFWELGKAEMVFNKAVRAVDSVAKGNFNRDHIRTLPFTESLEAHCVKSTQRKR